MTQATPSASWCLCAIAYSLFVSAMPTLAEASAWSGEKHNQAQESLNSFCTIS